MEKFDLYDRNRCLIGKKINRGEKLSKGEYRLVVHVAIFNENNEMLIQQRTSTKDVHPNVWDISAGGSVSEGEDSALGANREVFEELGLNIDFSKELPAFSFSFAEGFDDVYLIQIDNLNLDSLVLQKEEVQRVRWENKEKILKMMEEKKFRFYNKSFISCCFEMKKNKENI